MYGLTNKNKTIREVNGKKKKLLGRGREGQTLRGGFSASVPCFSLGGGRGEPGSNPRQAVLRRAQEGSVFHAKSVSIKRREKFNYVDFRLILEFRRPLKE